MATLIETITNTETGEKTVITHEVPDAAPPAWNAFDFKSRFTADERKAIRAAAKLNADVEDFVDMLDTAAATNTMIHSDNALVIAALTAMDGTLLAAGRKDEILGVAP